MQFCITTAGFIGAGLIVNAAFTDWSENPVITSVDSIAAPIDLIQFPTITICQDETRQPDNWAFLETIFNNIPFECNTECNTTEQTREERHEESKSWNFRD